MQELINELRNRQVHIVFLASSYQGGGIAAANYKILGCMDGFLKIQDTAGRIEYCNLAQINRIRLLPDSQKQL